MSPPVHPRDAASLVLQRHRGSGLEVLMGRRPPRDRFMPDVFVFPGGRVEPSDARLPVESLITKRVATRLKTQGERSKARALATAAIRETWEETGLIVGSLRAGRLKPNQAALDYLGRAITPAQSKIRYHARFFTASAQQAHGTLTGNGELIDLQWIPIEEALRLPIIDVTDAILRHVQSIRPNARAQALFIHYRNGVQQIRPE